MRNPARRTKMPDLTVTGAGDDRALHALACHSPGCGMRRRPRGQRVGEDRVLRHRRRHCGGARGRSEAASNGITHRGASAMDTTAMSQPWTPLVNEASVRWNPSTIPAPIAGGWPVTHPASITGSRRPKSSVSDRGRDYGSSTGRGRTQRVLEAHPGARPRQ